ncbi:hypothetical protein ACFW5V_31350 [Streptomyces sp. NPDC058762]|uniref:hypothetical protein n=1 Tax=Streptomyces sp. NPDC058762 TaxID=3346629 RepID=UPI0036B26737
MADAAGRFGLGTDGPTGGVIDATECSIAGYLQDLGVKQVLPVRAELSVHHRSSCAPVVSVLPRFEVLVSNVGVPVGSPTLVGLQVDSFEDAEGGEAMSTDVDKQRRRWTGPERWQVVLGAASLLVAVIALAVQFAQ